MRKIFLTLAVILALACPALVTLAGDIHNPGYCGSIVCPPPEPSPTPEGLQATEPDDAYANADSGEDDEGFLENLLSLLGL
jgi:hypothetical protein